MMVQEGNLLGTGKKFAIIGSRSTSSLHLN